jgi:hypothetical protein
VYPNPADTTDYGYPIVVSGGNYAYYFPTMETRRWTDWWGTGDPVFPDNWNTGGTVIASLDNFPGFGGFSGDPFISTGDTVEGGYELTLGGSHSAATVSLVNGTIQADIACQGGSSYTLTIPLPAQSYPIAAGVDSPQPTGNPHSSLVFQGSTTATPPAGVSACVGGHTVHAYFSANGLSVGGDGNPGGPGLLTTDVTDPLSLSFHLLDSNNGEGTFYSVPVTINWNPLTSSDSTNQNPAP